MTLIDGTLGTGWGMSSSSMSLILALVFSVLLLGVWYITGSILVLRERSVEKPNRVPQLYGYTVCLVALLLGLMSAGSLLDSAFERAYPLQGGDLFGQSLSSFEAFKAKRAVYPTFGRDAASPADTASEQTLRVRYDALVADRLASVRFETSKSFVTHGVLLVLALALFRFHWRWVRRLNGAAPDAA
jgi:hypothetical protein